MQASTVAMCGPDDELADGEGDVETDLEVLLADPPQAASATPERTIAQNLNAADVDMAAVVSQGGGPVSIRLATDRR
jgi:hypothetical protein